MNHFVTFGFVFLLTGLLVAVDIALAVAIKKGAPRRVSCFYDH